MTQASVDVSGVVNFPVHSDEWVNTREGGTVVKLVVCNRPGNDSSFTQCAGVGVFDYLCLVLVGDDKRPRPSADRLDNLAAVDAAVVAEYEWEAYHFPSNNNAEADARIRLLSRDYLAVMVLGSTAWTGYHVTHGGEWLCRFQDLTEQGQAMYKMMEAQYPGCDIHLLTFIDT